MSPRDNSRNHNRNLHHPSQRFHRYYNYNHHNQHCCTHHRTTNKHTFHLYSPHNNHSRHASSPPRRTSLSSLDRSDGYEYLYMLSPPFPPHVMNRSRF